MELRCIECRSLYSPNELRYSCDCGGLLEVVYKDSVWNSISPKEFDQRLMSREDIDRSGVWRFREAILGFTSDDIVTHPEGRTSCYRRSLIESFAGSECVYLKHEGENPTGSFKDRGMTCAISQAKKLGMKVVGCASTGNTSASLAAYAAQAGMKAIVFLPRGKVAMGKISQALGYGASCLAIDGDFDQAMIMVQSLAKKGALYMVNSLNPFRLEGQKSVIWEALQDLGWQAPDWFIVPGGNLGNTSAFGKAIEEAFQAGWIKKLPRLATIQAAGANPFYLSYKTGFTNYRPVKAQTIATAVQIGDPVNYAKAVGMIKRLNGVVEQVADEEILLAKTAIDREGIGCEPASACSLAGLKKLITSGVIRSDEKAVCILTGHMLKDPEVILEHCQNAIVDIPADPQKSARIVNNIIETS